MSFFFSFSGAVRSLLGVLSLFDLPSPFAHTRPRANRFCPTPTVRRRHPTRGRRYAAAEEVVDAQENIRHREERAAAAEAREEAAPPAARSAAAGRGRRPLPPRTRRGGGDGAEDDTTPRRPSRPRQGETGIQPRRGLRPEHRLRRTLRPQRLLGLEEARRHRGRHALVDRPTGLGLVVPRPRRVRDRPGHSWRRRGGIDTGPARRSGPSCSWAPRLGRGGCR